jgi:hypothetical protein
MWFGRASSGGAATDAKTICDLGVTAMTQRLEVRCLVGVWPVKSELVLVVNVGRCAWTPGTDRIRDEEPCPCAHPPPVCGVAAHATPLAERRALWARPEPSRAVEWSTRSKQSECRRSDRENVEVLWESSAG